MEARAFAPLYNPSTGTAQLNFFPSTTVASSASATASTQLSGSNWNAFVQLRIANKTTAWAHVNVGNLGIGAVTPATVASSPCVAPGAVEIWSVPGDVNGVSVILDAASTGSTSVIFTRGEGL